jgi:hypothetical protein
VHEHVRDRVREPANGEVADGSFGRDNDVGEIRRVLNSFLQQRALAQRVHRRASVARV